MMTFRTSLLALSSNSWALIFLLLASSSAAIAIYAMRKRWGWAAKMTDHPFTVYVVLSLVAHLILAIWAYTAQLFSTPPSPGPSIVTVELGDGLTVETQEPQPWDIPPTESVAMPSPSLDTMPEPPSEVEKPSTDTSIPESFVDSAPLPSQTAAPEPSRWSETAAESVAEEISTELDEPEAFVASEASTNSPEAPSKNEPIVSTPVPQQAPRLDEEPTLDAAVDTLASNEDETMSTLRVPEPMAQGSANGLQPTALPVAAAAAALRPLTADWKPGKSVPIRTSATPTRPDGRPLPEPYQDRVAPSRAALVRERGGGTDTEAGVEAALVWLAKYQSLDGRWDASHYGGGQVAHVAGQHRNQAGIRADTGITGLAVLAFLGAGHTHMDGAYQDTVRRALDYLMRAQTQRNDGSLAGEAGTFAAMYCHGIATLAMSECYAMTGDAQLLPAVRRAIGYSLSAQHSSTGGWRYRPHESGDTSQLGWQLMALTSAHYGGIQIPRSTWSGIGRFLNSVSWGTHGGLAAYRPGERPSASMTAEALMCRLFLGLDREHPLVSEAADYLMTELPGTGRTNFYYWYYGTLALYQLQDARWTRWNDEVKRTLLSSQKTSSPLAGSWDTDSVWGGSGGRVYTTALAALTLEVYYRYRPPEARAQRPPARTAWRTR